MKTLRTLGGALLAVIGINLACAHQAGAADSADPAELRIGYQKGSIALVLAKEQGLL